MFIFFKFEYIFPRPFFELPTKQYANEIFALLSSGNGLFEIGNSTSLILIGIFNASIEFIKNIHFQVDALAIEKYHV